MKQQYKKDIISILYDKTYHYFNIIRYYFNLIRLFSKSHVEWTCCRQIVMKNKILYIYGCNKNYQSSPIAEVPTLKKSNFSIQTFDAYFVRVARTSATRTFYSDLGFFNRSTWFINRQLSDKIIVLVSNLCKDDFFIFSIDVSSRLFRSNLQIFDDEKRFKRQPIR